MKLDCLFALLLLPAGLFAQSVISKSQPMTDPNVGYDHSPTHIVTVTVNGGVNRPGQYRLPASHSIWEAIEAAGSFSPVGEKNNVRLLRTVGGMNHHFRCSWDSRKAAPFPLLLRDRDVISVGIPPPDLIPGHTARIRIIAPETITMENSGRGAFIRFDPKLAFANISPTPLYVPSGDRGAYTTALLMQFTVVGPDGARCEASQTETTSPDLEEGILVAPDGEKLFALPAEYRIKVPGPGEYRVTATLSFNPPRQHKKYLAVKSDEFVIEVVPAGAPLPGIPRVEISLPAIFGDHMVLQRDRPIPIWGQAEPGEEVAVEFSEHRYHTVANASGNWRVNLPPLPASAEPRALTVRGKNTLTFSDVLVGEVWFLSGQSNMEKPLGPRSGQKPTDNYEEELTRADCPTLRLFQVPQHAKPKPNDGTMAWVASSGETLMKTRFSAAGYYFGRELQRELGVPVGLIHSSFGGTRIEAWMPLEAFDSAALRDLPNQKYQAWVKGVQATELYQSMVTPFVPFALRGFLWYQGEANVMNAEHLLYAKKMRALIAAWRKAWGDPDAPFYFAQIAPFFYSGQKNWEKQLTPLALPAIWEAQQRVLDVPQTGIVVTSDLAGSGRDIHPTNKRDVGLRFARLALTGEQAPRFASAETRAGKVTVSFGSASGLQSSNGQPPAGFEVAGADQVFHPADAVIDGTKVVVSSPNVPNPVAVRFAFTELAMPNLVNAAGLPALPFRTDDWPLTLEAPKGPGPSLPADKRETEPRESRAK